MKKTLLPLLLLILSLISQAQIGPERRVYETQPKDIFAIFKGDIDGDGDMDYINLRDFGRELEWIECLGNGNFGQPQFILDSLRIVKEIFPVDINNDGNLDLLINAEEASGWLEGLGNGRFTTFNRFKRNASKEALYDIYPCDIGNDGIIDVLTSVRGSTGNLAIPGWLRNDGKGNFGSFNAINTEQKRQVIMTAADIDGDGDNDVVSYRKGGEAYWYEEKGNGDFTIGEENYIGYHVEKGRKMAIKDMDKDGDLDVVFSKPNFWFANNGDKTFGGANTIGNTGEKILHGEGLYEDLDGDGYPEMLALYYSGLTTNLSVYKNGEDASFSQRVNIQSVNSVYGGAYGLYYSNNDTHLDLFLVSLEDVDGDGDLDLVVSDKYLIDWFENLGDLEFDSRKPLYRPKGSAENIHARDMDNDGDLDLILRASKSNNIVWKENLGRGNYGPEQIIIADIQDIYKSVFLPPFILCDDIYGNGLTDIFYVHSGRIDLYRNLGKGQFSLKKEVVSTNLNLHKRFIRLGDVDGDGDKDLVWGTSLNIANSSISWNENLGNGDFGPSQSILLNTTFHYMHLADLNSDGSTDIVLDPHSLNGDLIRFTWIQHTVGGDFSQTQFKTTENLGLRTSYPVDMDNDGRVDILHFASKAGHNYFLLSRNLGNGSFGDLDTMMSYYDPGFKAPSLTQPFILDIDGDGWKDVIWNTENVMWCKSLGGENLSDPMKIAELGDHLISDLADVDADGDPDILFADVNAGWHENFTGPLVVSPEKALTLEGKVFFDENQSGTFDKGEIGMPGFKVETNSSNAIRYSYAEVDYVFKVSQGLHTLSVDPPNDLWDLTTDSATYTRSISAKNSRAKGLDFGYFPKKQETILKPTLRSALPRCVRTIMFWPIVQNSGTTRPSGYVHLKLDESLKFVGAFQTPDSVVGQNIYWSYEELGIRGQMSFPIKVEMPGVNDIDNRLVSQFTVYELNGVGDVVYTSSDTISQSIRCAVDPNDKQVSPLGLGTEGYVHPEQELTYLIRFQNTGNDTAFNVMVRDQLDPDLDWSTMKPLSSSHSYEVYLEDDGDLVFKFDSILLVDSVANEPESHGFVEYSILPKSKLKPLTEIDGPADIYFDFNKPITTNNVLNTISCYTAPKPVISLKYPVLDAGVSGEYQFSWYRNDTLIEGATESTYRPVLDAVYRVEIEDENTCMQSSEAYNYTISSVNELRQMDVSVYPNPFSETTTLEFDRALNQKYDLVIYNLVGAEVKRITNIKGNRVSVDGKEIGKGVYFAYLVNVSENQRVFAEKLIVH